MKHYLLFMGIFATLAAQTAVKPDQLRATPAPSARLLAFDAAGKLTLIELGAGVQIVDGSLVVTTTTQSPVNQPPVLAQSRIYRSAAGVYPATNGIVTRNGVVQERGVDYSIDGVVLVPASPWSPDDIVLVITAERAPSLTAGVSPKLIIPPGWAGRYGRNGNTWYWPAAPLPEVTGYGAAVVLGVDKAPAGTTFYDVPAK